MPNRWWRILAVLVLLQVVPAAESVAAAKKTTVKQPRIAMPEVYLAAPPQFLRPTGELYHVAVEVPYDLFYVQGMFFLNSRGNWFVSDFFEGPWEFIRASQLPESLRGASIKALRSLREQTLHAYEEHKGDWPADALFIPETIDNDADPPGTDEVSGDDPELLAGSESLKPKGE